jgi:transcriptional regulator with XRE-family HTH domain
MHAVPDEPSSEIDPFGPLDIELLAIAQTRVRDQIRVLRTARRISQTRAAARIGRKQPYWSLLENGGLELTLEHLIGIQYALGLESVESLFGELPSQRVIGGPSGREADA